MSSDIWAAGSAIHRHRQYDDLSVPTSLLVPSHGSSLFLAVQARPRAPRATGRVDPFSSNTARPGNIHDMPTTVILGAGIIGLSSAHALAALAPPDHHIHLVDPAPHLFASASGKAAGFLAKDWFAPATNPLGALSFDLHRDLALRHDGFRRWGYSQSVSYSLDHAYDSDDARSESDSSRSDKINLNAPSNSPPQAEGTTAPAPLTAANSAAATGTAAASSPSQSDLSPGPTETPSRAPEEQAAAASSPVPDWVLSGGSRRSSVDSAHAAGRGAGLSTDALPAWLHAPPAALEALSDATSTAQV